MANITLDDFMENQASEEDATKDSAEIVAPEDTNANGDGSTGDAPTGSASSDASTEATQEENADTSAGTDPEQGEGTNGGDEGAAGEAQQTQSAQQDDAQQNNEQQNTIPQSAGQQNIEQQDEATAEPEAPFDPDASFSKTLKAKKEHKCLKRTALKTTSLAISLAELSLLSIFLGPVLGVAAFLVLRYNAELNAVADFWGYKPMLIPASMDSDKAIMKKRRDRMRAARHFAASKTKSGLFNTRVGGKQLFQSAKRYFGARHRNRVNSRNNNGPTPAM